MTTVRYTPVLEVVIKLITDDNTMSTYTIKEGQRILGLTYRCGGETITVDGIVDAIPVAKKAVYTNPGQILDGRSTNPASNPASCPVQATAPFTLALSGMIVDISHALHGKHIFVRFEDIVSIDTVEDVDKTVTAEDVATTGITSVIAEMDAGATLTLAEGAYVSDVAIDKSVTVVGPNDVPQKAKAQPLTRSVDLAGAAIDGAISINAPSADVTFRGLTFTGKSMPVITAANMVRFINCRFENLQPADAKTMGINLLAGAKVKLTIQGCYFGKPADGATGTLYNLFELTGKLVSGSSFANNYFDLACCSHNIINIYDCVNGAEIRILQNYAAQSKTMVRVGIKGSVTAKIHVTDNKYDTTDTNPDWAGIVMAQPYAKETLTMSGWTILINGTKYPVDQPQLAYIYFGANDLTYSEDVLPAIYIDDVLTAVKVINDQAVAG